jgi:catechol 2,3-dioxygenase-like lactoylglutathione lyase family enzyme
VLSPRAARQAAARLRTVRGLRERCGTLRATAIADAATPRQAAHHTVIDHIGLTVSDLPRAQAFYAAALAPIGYRLLAEFAAELTGAGAVAGFGVPPKPDLWLAAGAPNRPAVHVALRVPTRELVDAFHAAALGAGGRDNGAPGPRPHYQAHYYGAFVLDPDGHNIEVVCHEPVP